MAELLKAGALEKSSPKYIFKALCHAASNANALCLELLVQAGADVNNMDESSSSPLISAASEGRTDCVNLLLQAGAYVNFFDQNGFTALMRAAYYGKVGCVKALLNTGADVNMLGHHGGNALKVASRTNCVRCVRLLLKANARINCCKSFYISDQISRRWFNCTTEKVIFAAGEKVPNQHGASAPYIVKFVKQQPDLDLHHMCRETIRNHLMKIDAHSHLFGGIPQLVSLDDDNDDDDKTSRHRHQWSL